MKYGIVIGLATGPALAPVTLLAAGGRRRSRCGEAAGGRLPFAPALAAAAIVVLALEIAAQAAAGSDGGRTSMRRRVMGIVLATLLAVAGVAAGQVDGELPELEFRDEPLRNVLMVIGDLSDVSVVTDSTVEGRVSQILQPMAASEALDLLAAEHGVLWWVEDAVVRVSRVRVLRNEEGSGGGGGGAACAPMRRSPCRP